MKRTAVTRDVLIRLWDEESRKVPLAVMLTTAELESGIGTERYDATAERFEKKLYQRALSDPLFWGAMFHAKTDWTSYGLFQILGINLQGMGVDYESYPDKHGGFVNGTSPPALEDLIRIQMRDYDRFMTALIRKHKIPLAFKRYNGSGPAADRYQAKAEKVYTRLLKEPAT